MVRTPGARPVATVAAWMRSRRSPRQRGPGSSGRSAARRPRRSSPGPRSQPACTCSCRRRPGRARRSPRSSMGSTGERRAGRGAAAPLRLPAEGPELRHRAEPPWAARGLALELVVGVRTGDTPQRDRQRMLRRPPDVLITTPESLYLLLTSQGRETLRGVETVILDEVHAVAGTKRGAHLAISLERLSVSRRSRSSGSASRRRSVRSRRSGAGSSAPAARSP